jgi:hypothetical protein
MYYKFFISSLINILLDPIKAWNTIDSENIQVKVVRRSYLFPLIILVSASAFVGSLIFTNTELSPVYSILVGIKYFLLLFFTVYVTSYILREITFPLDLGRDFSVSFKIIVFSVTPFLLCQILSCIFESLLFVNILALYGLYIFWTGAEKLLNPPQYKKMPLLVAAVITLGGVYLGISMLLNKIIDKIFFVFFA